MRPATMRRSGRRGFRIAFSSNMEKATLLVLCFFVCRSQQRPQLDESDDPVTTTETVTEIATTTATATTTTTSTITADTTTEDDIIFGDPDDNRTQATEATAVSVQTSVNVSSSGPSRLYGDFKPSIRYRPEVDPAVFERPSQQVTHEMFYPPPYFRRPTLPDGPAHGRFPPQPDDKRNVVFPQATQVQYTEHKRPFDNGTGSGDRPVQEFRGSSYNKPFVGMLPQHKPIKHDSGDLLPVFTAFDGGVYDGSFGNHPTNEMYRYPAEVMREPPEFYHNVATRKKKDPWRSVLSVLATILPVGLLLASFPPTVIKVNSTQYPYQFQKNSTAYNPNIVTGRFKTLRKKNAGRQIKEENEFSGYLDNCLKNKICENIKTNHSPNELASLLQNSKLNTTDNYDSMLEIAEAAASVSPDSCQVFVCNKRTRNIPTS